MPRKLKKAEISMMFKMPPEKAISYFQKKVPVGPSKHWNWSDSLQHVHDRVFVVSKATSLDLVKDIQNALVKSMKEGKPYQDFANNIIPTLKEKGWWGKAEAINSTTGEVNQINVDHNRLRRIYNTNVKTAYASGRYEKMMEDADIAPYWRYVAVPKGSGNKNPRAEHALLHNLVFRFDDPFWKTHFAPNGWGCHCTVSRMTQRMVEKKFGKNVDEVVRKSDPEDFVIETSETQGNKVTRTGYKVGNKTSWTDNGWDYAPGEYSLQYQTMLEDKYNALKEKDLRKELNKQLGSSISKSFENIIENESKLNMPNGNRFAVGMMSDEIRNVLNTKKDKSGRTLDVKTSILTISDKSIKHALRNNHPAIPKDVLKKLPQAIKEWIPTYTPSEGLVFYSEEFEKGKRYKVAFGQENTKSDKFTFKTGMVVDARALRIQDIISK